MSVETCQYFRISITLTRTLTWSGFEEGGRQVEPLGRPEEGERLLVEREAEHQSGVVGGATR